jgi:uncharacterized protein (TIGR03067 family)
MSLLSLMVVMTALLIGADGHKEDSTKKDLEKLAGTWETVSIESANEKVKWKIRFNFSGKELIISDPADPEGHKNDKTTYRINPNNKPNQIDVTFVRAPGSVVDGKTLMGIYSFDGDLLKICWRHKENERPTQFTGKRDNEWTLIVLKRKRSAMREQRESGGR